MKQIICTISLLGLLLYTHSAISAEKDKVFAKIGDISITQKIIDEYVSEVPPEVKRKMSVPAFKSIIIRQIVDMKVYSLKARKIKLDKDPAVKKAIANMTDQVLANELIKKIKAEINISENQMQNYYNKNRSRYKEKEQVKVSHILVKTQEQAKAIIKELQAGKNFAKLAQEKSTCSSKSRGGDLGWLPRGRIDPEFDKAAFSLKKGEISGIVKTKYGFHIIKLEDRKEERQMSFDEAKAQVRKEIEAKRLQDAKEKIKKELKVEIYEEALKPL